MRTQRCIPAPRAKTVANAIRGRMKKWFFTASTLEVNGTQYTPRSGNLKLRVRMGRPVKPHG